MKLDEHVIVVTGASSGIGRATVEVLAERGATVVAIARREPALTDLERAHAGGSGHVVGRTADVTDAAALETIAAEVVGTYGRLDAWVNNAGVNQYGRFEEVPLDEWRRVIEINLFGYAHGARAAIPHFREQGHGVLINVGSVISKVPSPLQSAYTASKFAIQGLGRTLRQELRDVPGIAVCTVLPGPIDTPLFQHAANRTGHRIEPPSPTVDALRVATAIARNVRRPRREVPIGLASTRVGLFFERLVPGLTERIGARVMEATHLTDQAAPPTPGNLYEPIAEGADVSGGWKPVRVGDATPALAVVGLAATAAAVGVAITSRR